MPYRLAPYAVLVLALSASPVVAQTDAEKLQRIEREIETRESRRDRLEKETQSLAKARRVLQARVIDLARQAQGIDAKRDALEQSLAEYDAVVQTLTQALTRDRIALSQTLASLQLTARDAPPAFAVHPDDALDAVQGAIALAGVVPNLTQRATDIRHRLVELRAIRARSAQKQIELAHTEAQAQTTQRALQTALEEKAIQEARARARAERENEAIKRLVGQARNLRELLTTLEQRAKPTRIVSRGDVSGGDGFIRARGLLPPPVVGSIVLRFGDKDTNGQAHRGITYAARIGAQITAPYDGRVLYAGVFRDYGEIVILGINADYNLLLTGLAAGQVYVGQEVLAGEPIGITHAPNRGRLYMEMRHHGHPIDPAPWIAKQG